jgi:hypothetical protein
MNTWVLVLMALLVVAFAAVHTAAAQQAQPERLPPAGELPQIVAFTDAHIEGCHIHRFGTREWLGGWENHISSMVILSGTWQFFDDEHFKGTMMKELGPGVYPHLKEVRMKDNGMSSIRPVTRLHPAVGEEAPPFTPTRRASHDRRAG